MCTTQRESANVSGTIAWSFDSSELRGMAPGRGHRGIREMISNAVCHRSYVSPGSIQVAIYDDRLEVTSPGRISPDLTMEQLKAGNSRVRNVAIGAAFQYMHIIEKWGTGIPRILKSR